MYHSFHIQHSFLFGLLVSCEMSCMKRDASPGSVHDAGCLGLVRWEGPGGWYGEVGREEGSGWGACVYLFYF